MKNIERFNLYTAHIFGLLYASFPVGRMVHFPEVFSAIKASLELERGEEDRQDRFFANTMMWLEETGYIRSRGSGQDRKIVLAPRAFEAMAAPLPKALRGTDELKDTASVGEKLVDVAAGSCPKRWCKIGRHGLSSMVARAVAQAAAMRLGLALGSSLKASRVSRLM